MKGSLDGKNVVITGSSRGIGLGIAKGFANANARLTLIADDPAVITIAKDIGEKVPREPVKLLYRQ